jgi:predicted alpha/beta hydrolase family esterase
MTKYLIIPGLGNSGPEHWQSRFERISENFHRIQQTEWDEPVCADWIANLDAAVTAHDPSTVILVAHSIGCLAVAHWAAKYQRIIKGALLVGPIDPELPQYETFKSEGFVPVPTAKLPFPTIVVASEDDPWVSLERAAHFADNWGAEFVNIGLAGHISTADGYGHWSEGWELVKSLG